MTQSVKPFFEIPPFLFFFKFRKISKVLQNSPSFGIFRKFFQILDETWCCNLHIIERITCKMRSLHLCKFYMEIFFSRDGYVKVMQS